MFILELIHTFIWLFAEINSTKEFVICKNCTVYCIQPVFFFLIDSGIYSVSFIMVKSYYDYHCTNNYVCLIVLITMYV